MNRRSMIAGIAAVAALAPLPALADDPKVTKFFDADFNEVARIWVSEVVEDGRRVNAHLHIEATGERPLDVSEYDFKCVDKRGHMSGHGSYYDNIIGVVTFKDIILLPGETIEGALQFEIPDGTEVHYIAYTGYNQTSDNYASFFYRLT
jgi:hypothetical protein